jgi:hypothetical protein
MTGQARQGFVEPEVDYRHAQLMSQVAQTHLARRPVNTWVHDLLERRSRRHAGQVRTCS